MNAIEKLVKTILSALDVDVEAVKTDITTRVEAFEENVKTLNETLIALHARTQRIEKIAEATYRASVSCSDQEFLQRFPRPPMTQEKLNGRSNGKSTQHDTGQPATPTNADSGAERKT